MLTEEYTARQVEAAAQTAFLELISSDPALEVNDSSCISVYVCGCVLFLTQPISSRLITIM